MTRIYYFSGTGNTLWSGKTIAERLGDCELINIGAAIDVERPLVEADAAVLLFPAYAYGAPPIVRRFVRKAVFRLPYLAVLVTHGTSAGGALAEIGRILKSKGVKRLYFDRIPAVENYLAIFGPQSEETQRRRIAMQAAKTEEVARNIAAGRVKGTNLFRPFSAFVSMLFALGARSFYKQYRLSGACTGCGLCAELCPVQGIVMRDGLPLFTDKCEHCQGCLNRCPQRAIFFGRLKADTPRYHHPGISEDDIRRLNLSNGAGTESPIEQRRMA